MNGDRKSAGLAGVFYIVATAAPSSAFILLTFLDAPDVLANVSAQAGQVVGGMFIELAWALAVVGIIVTLLPVLKKHNASLALGFFSLRLMEAMSVIVGTIVLMTLLALSQEYAGAVVPSASHYRTAGTLLLAARDWAFRLGSGFVFSLSALILNWLLYQSELIPRWLSSWGLVGAALSLAAYLMQVFDVNVDILHLLIAAQEMVFAVWLIVRGFNPSAIAAGYAESDAGGA
jgi:hypothetical protein